VKANTSQLDQILTLEQATHEQSSSTSCFFSSTFPVGSIWLLAIRENNPFS